MPLLRKGITLTRKDYRMAGNVTELTDATFTETVQGSDMPVLVDFWAPWCGPCKMMAPVIDQVAADYSGRALICKVNTDDAREAGMSMGITAIPTLILFKNGQIEKKWVGMTSKKDIAAAIDELL